MPAQNSELRGHPFGARKFMKSGCGDAAKLEVNVVHPGLILREELECVADGAALGKIADTTDQAGSDGRGWGCHQTSVAARDFATGKDTPKCAISVRDAFRQTLHAEHASTGSD